MKIRIRIRTVGGREWDEEYSPDTHDPEKWAADLVSRFNASLRHGEEPRMVLAVKVLDLDHTEKPHDWAKRTDGMSVSTKTDATVDLMFCRRCGVTGKRYGLRPSINRDHRYRAKRYAFCSV